MTRPAPGPGGLRRPLWLPTASKPDQEAYYLTQLSPPMFTLEMIIIGGLTGVLSGLLGVGGGFIMIPLLIATGFLMRGAVAVSLLYVTFTAASGTLRHLRLGTVDPILGLILLSGATPMVLVGSHYSTILPHQTLQVVFALLVMGAAAAYPCWVHGAYLTAYPIPG